MIFKVASEFNPEAIIAATIAARAAELAANQVFYILMVIVFLLLGIGAMVIYILVKVSEVKYPAANGHSTRVITGRAELTEEVKKEEKS